MFIITFYSYKGGVGRTMALVNAAAELTKRGRRVLVIDFDLEAPGISTYQPFRNSDQRPGIVDYVSQYLEQFRAPDINNFIVECDLPLGDEAQRVWVLPAGRRDDGYASKLASIDWQDLYANRSGYLLFEDLKQQLQNDSRRFDYVLIDSRTGYTDVGGICTRQLAEVVVLMFFPNEQNISGLTTMAAEIRAENERRARRTELLFVPSNVPDLDDEDGILKKMMDLSKEELKYDEPSSVIHHYDSLSLVEQSIFTISRPNSRLAEEYRTLTDSIVQLNIEDREGVLSALRRVREYINTSSDRGIRRPFRTAVWYTRTLNSLDSIGRLHSSDGEVAWTLATVYRSLGNLSNELNALNDAAKAGYNLTNVKLRRAMNLLNQSRQDEAKIDLHAVLSSENATALELVPAVEALRTIDARWFEALELAPALSNLRPSDVVALGDVLMSDTNSLPIARGVIAKALRETESEGERLFLVNQFSLILIGMGEFGAAMRFIAEDRDELDRSDDIAMVFNYAMAEWGLSRLPPSDLIDRVVEMGSDDPETRGANYLQCLALCYALHGNHDTAQNYIAKGKKSLGPSRVFSSWCFRYVDRDMMLRDFEAMERSISENRIDPPFLHPNSHLALHH